MLLKRRPWRLRTRIIAWSFFPTTLILLAVALVTFYAYQHVTEDLVIDRNRELARLSAGQLSAGLEEYSRLLDSVARTPGLYNGNAAEQRQALLHAANRLVVFDGGVLVLNAQGRVVASQPERPDAMGRDWSGKPFFGQLLRSSEPVFSDITTDGPGGAEVIMVAVWHPGGHVPPGRLIYQRLLRWHRTPAHRRSGTHFGRRRPWPPDLPFP